jgi:hypothetical protein
MGRCIFLLVSLSLMFLGMNGKYRPRGRVLKQPFLATSQQIIVGIRSASFATLMGMHFACAGFAAARDLTQVKAPSKECKWRASQGAQGSYVLHFCVE